MDACRDFDPDGVDLSLFGFWPDGRESGPPGGCKRLEGRVVLELKSMPAVSPVDELAGLLNELTAEMGEQFRLFRKLRADAEAGLSGDSGTGAAGEAGEAGKGSRPDPKTARADVKGATDAMSLIVRTLEKIDSLQRQLARDRADAEARRAEEDDDAAIHDRLERLIDAKANERALQRLQSWKNGDGDPFADGIIPSGEPGHAPGAGSG